MEGVAAGSSSSVSVELGRVPLSLDSFQSKVDQSFWQRLSSLKLNTPGIDDSPINITGFFSPCLHPKVSQHLTLLAESLPPENGEKAPSSGIRRGGRNSRCPVPGILYNTNTLANFHDLDRMSLLKMEAKKIWQDIFSGRVEEESAVLLRFLVISFADLKKWEFRYWFAFPALVIDPLATLVDLRPASQVLTADEAKSLSVACKEWRDSSLTTDVPFFLVSIAPDSRVSIRPLKDWELCQGDGRELLYGFYDPCHRPNKPGWPLRNFLAFIRLRWKTEKARFLCYREERGYFSMGLSLVGEALVSLPQGTPEFVFEAKIYQHC